ncbi:MAG: hypothetical protein HZC44_13530 [Geobacter sp.]|nr:hypothetical protein [Geobacter sp.]
MIIQTKSKPIYSTISVLAPVVGLATHIVIATLVGATDTTHGLFKVMLVAELLWYASIVGFVSGLIGVRKREHPKLLGYVGLIVNGVLATFFTVAILTS